MNEQKAFCSHQCSPECWMKKFRAYISSDIYFVFPIWNDDKYLWSLTLYQSIILFLKLVSVLFTIFLFFQQKRVLRTLWKNAFYFMWKALYIIYKINFLYFTPSLFSSVSHCFRRWLKINFKVYDAINGRNKNSITDFVLYLEQEKDMTLKLCT